MRVLLFGVTGGLGRALVRLFDQHNIEIQTPTSRECDLVDLPRTVQYTEDWCHRNANGVILYAAGLTNIDVCEENPRVSARLNTLAPCMIAEIASYYGHRFVYFSTDQVFGPNGANYRHHEADRVGEQWPAENVYGRDKGLAEYRLERLPRTDIVRVQWLYGGRSSWVDYVVEQAKLGNPILALTDYVGIPTHVNDVAEAVWEILRYEESHQFWHFVAEGNPVNRAALARFVLEEIGRTAEIQETTVAAMMENRWVAPRNPRGLLRNHHGPRLRPWTEALAGYLHAHYVSPQQLTN